VSYVSSVGSATIRSVATDEELKWALTYDGYERFSRDMSAYYELLRPAMSAYEKSGRIPDWCGVDLLRAWAFYRQREHHNLGHGLMARDWDNVLDAIRRHPAAKDGDFPPHRFPGLTGEWAVRLRSTLEAPYWSKLVEFIDTDRGSHEVFPAPDRTFRAFELTPYEIVRVVILGQDPYPTPGDADGLAFSVSTPASKTPDTLKSIFKELASDIGVAAPESNSLEGWARQGVLLLNTALTLRAGSDEDHAVHRRWRWNRQGWTTFTDAVISAIAARDERVVFILWGNDARRKAKLIDRTKHDVIEQVHPSPLSAYKGFFGSRPFTRTNDLLRDGGRGPIDWARTV
jgi:uracil-DNA glycosylase